MSTPETQAPPAPITETTALKFLTSRGTGQYSKFAWPLPEGDQPGQWVGVEGNLVLCQNGLHLLTAKDWAAWRHDRLFVAEYDGERLDDGDKFAVRRARLLREVTTWNPTTLRLFACDCAEHALPIFERKYPDDKRPREAIAVARRYARGEATAEERQAARRAAADAYAASDADVAVAAYADAHDVADAYAYAHAGAAAAAYAYAAAVAATAAYAYAAYAYAHAVADAAAYAYAAAAAAAAARKTEREWQVETLLSYLNGARA